MKQQKSIYAGASIPRISSKPVFPLLVGLLTLAIVILSSIYNKRKRDTAFAYQETRRALNHLTSNINKGVEKMAYLKEFEVAKQKIYSY